MTTWNPRANELFLKALELEPPARQAYLEEACAGDAALRAEVEALLQASDRAGSFLAAPIAALAASPAGPEGIRAAVTVDEATAIERPGTVIGPYKVLEEIGEGGFGVVFMAEQREPIRRKVALKVLKPGMDTRQVVARFEAERQALALMDHPNIAHILDGGATASGRPYFVMELVKGVPITQFCDHNHLPPRARLELFVSVCQAVQHAHQKGIIHRDLKPSNVLISLHDTKPVVKVIDFGIAKAVGQVLTDKTLFTGFNQMIGTPLYMSPEQAGQSGLDVDTRSDIYSLGVLLYELLTGTTPFEKERLGQVSYDEMRRIIREEEPPRPSTRFSTLGQAADTISANRQSDPKRLSQLMRDELDWIVMKALEKDRNRRYESPSAFAADVQRYLNDEPVQACPPSVWYRFRKFARRRKAALATAGALALAALLCGASAFWLLSKEADREREADRRTTELRQGVETDFQTAVTLREQARWVMAQQVLARTRERLGENGPEDLRERLEQMIAAVDLAQSLDAVRQKRVTVVEGKFDNRSTDQDYAAAFRRANLVQEGEVVEAVAARIRASAIKEQLVAALDDWASATKERSRRAWLLAVARRADPDKWRDKLRDPAVWEDPTTLRRLAEEALAGEEAKLAKLSPPLLAALGMALQGAGPAGALPFLTAAQSRYPNDFWLNMNLGLTLSRARKKGDAVGYYRAALAIRPESVVAYTNLGTVLHGMGRTDEAILEFQKALEFDPRFALAHVNLGVALVEKGRKALPVLGARIAGFMGSTLGQGPLLAASAFISASNCWTDEAIKHYNRAIEIDRRDAAAHNNLGNALQDQGRLDEAIREYLTAIDIAPEDAPAHYNLGLALKDKNRLGEAIQEWRKAVKFDHRHAPAHYNLGLGLALTGRGQLDEAIGHYKKALEIDPKNALFHYSLGNALQANSQLDEAIKEYREAIKINPEYVWAHNNLGNALKEKGWLDEAIKEYRRVIDLDPGYALAHNNLGNALRDKGQLDEAIREYRRAIKLDFTFAAAHFNLGNTLLLIGQRDEAMKEYREAIKINPEDAEAHSNLGALLQGKGQLVEAIEEYRKAIQIDGRNATFHDNLGTALRDNKQLREAIKEWREAIKIDPRHVKAQCSLGAALVDMERWDEALTELKKAIVLAPNDALTRAKLGLALRVTGQLDEAIRELKRAVEPDPQNPRWALAHGALGEALLMQGRFVEARAATRRCLNLLPERHPLRKFAIRQLQQCERLIVLDEKLPAILKGKETPANEAERLALARLCGQYKHLYTASARFYTEAFETKPELARNLATGHRYNAACAAGRAGCGQGKDADKLEDKERARLRQQALSWLRADLEGWEKLLDMDPNRARSAAIFSSVLQRWMTAPDFSGVRGPGPLAKLPEAEQQPWQDLWNDVTEKLARVQGKTTPQKK